MKETFILYTEYSKHLALLSMEQRGVLFTAIISYQAGEELPEMDSVTQMAFSFIRSDLDRSEESYQKKLETNRENGKRGGRPKKETETQKPNGFEEKPKKPNGYFENPNELELDSDNDILSTVGLSAGAREEVEEQTAEYQAFMEEHPKIVADITNPSLIGTVDFALLSEKIAESGFLQSRYSLSWLIGNYRKIIADGYKDYRRAPPKEEGDPQLRYLRELYEEAKEEDRRNAERNGREVNHPN